MEILTSVESVLQSKAEDRKSGLTIVEGFVPLPESASFEGKFKTDKVNSQSVPQIARIQFKDKKTGEAKVFYKALNSVTLLSSDANQNGKPYEGGVPFESVEELLSVPQNLNKVYSFKTSPKSLSGNVYMTIAD